MSSHLRPGSRPLPSASSPRTNPHRTNNDRDQPPSSRDTDYESFERGAPESGGAAASVSTTDRAVRQADKVRQVTQNFFRRAALTIVNSRVNLAAAYNPDTNQPRSSKWFQLIMDESDELAEDVEPWVRVDVKDQRPSAMIVEIYLDTGDLTRNQTLVVVDERGKKWDVCEAMKAPSNAGSSRGKRERSPQIILERWRIQLDEASVSTAAPAGSSSSSSSSSNNNEPMANVYKKAVIMFRSLFSYARFLPAWKLARSIAKEPATLMALRPMYRVLKESQLPTTKDSLTASFYPSAEPVCETYTFAPVRSPAGAFSVDVTYRRNCNFRVADYEALVSSYYMGMDQPGEPSSLGDGEGDRGLQYPTDAPETGSLPVNRKWAADRQELNQAYGSLSTFHHAGHGTGTSPISALRAARETQMDSPGADMSPPPLRPPPDHRTSMSSKSSLKSNETPPPTAQRRVSVSFQPFKAGSLSSSPGQAGLLSQSPAPSLSRPSNITQGLAQARNRTSLTALPQTALRIPQSLPSPEVAVGSPGSASPKAPPIVRYSSSFGHRRSRMSSGGGSGSRFEEDNSSGRGSGNSSKRGSVTLVEGDGGGSGSSGGSMQTDDDNISDFLSLLEQKKDLKSFNRTDDASRDASNRRTASALNRYRGLRESTAALSESMSSSVMMRHSSGSSSQRLSGVPPALVGASVSTSSSPGKPISPHTPHTPAIPSRLSEQATIRDRDHSRNRGGPPEGQSSGDSPSNDGSIDSTSRAPGSGAIPIPTSPSRFHHHHVRRSSSAHQRNRAGMVDLEPFDLRPASVPTEDRPDLSLSEMVQMQEETFVDDDEDDDEEGEEEGNGGGGRQANVGVNAGVGIPDLNLDTGSSIERDESERSRGGNSQKPKSRSHAAGKIDSVATGVHKTQTKPSHIHQQSLHVRGGTSRSNSGSTSTSSFGRGSTSRFSFSNRPGATSSSLGDDDEPLLFTMSELGRRSLEDMNVGGPGAGGAPAAGGGGGGLGRSGNGSVSGVGGATSAASKRK